jgi:hypothetical protein
VDRFHETEEFGIDQEEIKRKSCRRKESGDQRVFRGGARNRRGDGVGRLVPRYFGFVWNSHRNKK